MKDALPVALGGCIRSRRVSTGIAQVRRLAVRLGYRLVWGPETSRIPLADQVRAAGAEVVIAPSTEHFDFIALNSVMAVADVETVNPRLSFSRWATGWQPGRGPK